MNKNVPPQPILAPLGIVEPHAPLLKVPPDGQLLYKIMSAKNLLRSIKGGYLYFSRVDSYADFSSADVHDGQQLPKDQQGNASASFKKAPHFSAADYYNRCRSRTYACCFSLENSDFIWDTYGNDSAVCVVFDFGKLRKTLNQTLQSGNAKLVYNGNIYRQIFSINYGEIKYVDWDTYQANTERRPKPIEYTYLKDENKFSREKELRISLSTIGMGQIDLPFQPNLQLAFDFISAIANQTIQKILCAPDCDFVFLQAELPKFLIVSRKRWNKIYRRIG